MRTKNDLSKSTDRFSNSASGIKYLYKAKRPVNQKTSHQEFYQTNNYSLDIELDEKSEINRKYKNKNNFKPSTKQTVDQNEYKKLKKKYDFEQIDEKSEEDPPKDNIEEDEINNNSINNSKNEKKRSGTPPSKVTKNIYTENFRPNKNKIIDDDEEDEEEKKVDDEKEKEYDDFLNLDDSNESEKDENKNKKNEKKNENKKNKKNKKEDSDENNEDKNDYKEPKEIESKRDDLKLKKKNEKRTKKKFNEEEYKKLISESKDYIPFKDYDINQFILTLSQMNNIKNNPELYKKYNYFLSLKKKQDKIQFETLLENILLNFKNISKSKYLETDITVNALFKSIDFSEFAYTSNEKTAYFDLFISFISMFTSDYKSFVEATSIIDTTRLVIPMHALAYIFSSQLFFCDMAKLMQMYYNQFLSYRIISIGENKNREYLSKIKMRHLIWKQFETPFLYYKNDKKLYLKESNRESKLDEKKIEEFSEQVEQKINQSYNNFVEFITKKHGNINKFHINDERITLTDKVNSVPSSLYNQINDDLIFKLKMNLYKYQMKQRKIIKLCKLNSAKIKKSEIYNTIKNNIFKQSIYFVNSSDAVQDFLENYN